MLIVPLADESFGRRSDGRQRPADWLAGARARHGQPFRQLIDGQRTKGQRLTADIDVQRPQRISRPNYGAEQLAALVGDGLVERGRGRAVLGRHPLRSTQQP